MVRIAGSDLVTRIQIVAADGDRVRLARVVHAVVLSEDRAAHYPPRLAHIQLVRPAARVDKLVGAQAP